jgi:hypothetical protein
MLEFTHRYIKLAPIDCIGIQAFKLPMKNKVSNLVVIRNRYTNKQL